MAGFEKVVGHPAVITHLNNSIQSGRVAHCYLFVGEDGIGKRMVATEFAKKLLCETPDGPSARPCGTCPACVAVDRGSHPDLKYIRHEKPATIGVDDVREQLNGDIVIRPYRADRKIYIIDEAELLNVQAQNAILKTIEEPPSYAVILLLSNNRDVFLETIRSRSVLVEFQPLRREDVARYIEAHFPPSDDREFALDHCRGNIGRALHLMEDENAREFVTTVCGILAKLPKLSVIERMDAVSELSQDREDVKEAMELFLAWYRDVAVLKATGDARRLQFGSRNIKKIEAAAQAYSFAALGRIFEKVRETKELLLANVNPESAFENLLLECGVAG